MNMDFPVPQYLLDEISDLEAEQEEESDPTLVLENLSYF